MRTTPSWLANVEAGHRGAALEPLLRLLDALGLILSIEPTGDDDSVGLPPPPRRQRAMRHSAPPRPRDVNRGDPRGPARRRDSDTSSAPPVRCADRHAHPRRRGRRSVVHLRPRLRAIRHRGALGGAADTARFASAQKGGPWSSKGCDATARLAGRKPCPRAAVSDVRRGYRPAPLGDTRIFTAVSLRWIRVSKPSSMRPSRPILPVMNGEGSTRPSSTSRMVSGWELT